MCAAKFNQLASPSPRKSKESKAQVTSTENFVILEDESSNENSESSSSNKAATTAQVSATNTADAIDLDFLFE